jgi:D-3-phosphoglycerate dehydrogenase
MTTATMTEPAAQTFGILAADKIAPEGLDWITSQNDCTLINKPGLSEEEYADLLAAGGVHAMIVRSGIKVTAAMLEKPGDLKVIARAGVGVDNIDIEAATAKGILVVNTAEASTITTAEHAYTLMCALARNIGPAYKTMTDGGWDRSKFAGTQLAGKTVGIVGFGRIGQTFAKRALAFEMDVLAYDPFINAPTMLDGQVKMYRDFKEMIPYCDILTFHVPLNDDTRGMLNEETFKLCREGVMVINAARGGVVDEEAILPALESGRCGGIALDVYTSEPPAEDSPLRSHPKVLCTPHLGASTKEAQTAVSTDAALQCLEYLRGKGIKGAVNAGGVRVDLDETQSAFVDLAERMSHLIAPMITRGIANVTIELGSKKLGPASGTIERTVLIGLLQPHTEHRLNVINVGPYAEQRGIKTRTMVVEEGDGSGAPSMPEIALEIKAPRENIDRDAPEVDQTRRIVGHVYDDGRPRVVEINGYHMDMVPAGHMAMIQNEDKPGIIGVVGMEFGDAGVNIADMTISRRECDGQVTALMVLKLDGEAPEDLLNRLLARPGILKVSPVKLPEEKG